MRISRTMIVAALPALLVAGCGSIGDRVSERVAEEVGAHIQVEPGFDTTVDYFERELPGSGWQITDTQRMSLGDDMSNVMFQVTGHGWEGVVTVQQLGAEGDDETIMGVLYALSAES